MENDLISREALKKAIQDNGYSHYYEIFSIIDNAPTVKPVWCDECEKALTCEKRKNTEIDGCYEGIKVGDT